jgi:hypothetical protein
MTNGGTMHTSEDSWADEAGTRIGDAGDDVTDREGKGETLRAIDGEARAFIKENCSSPSRQPSSGILIDGSPRR